MDKGEKRDEADQRRDALLLRLLKTPPDPRKRRVRRKPARDAKKEGDGVGA